MRGNPLNKKIVKQTLDGKLVVYSITSDISKQHNKATETTTASIIQTFMKN